MQIQMRVAATLAADVRQEESAAAAGTAFMPETDDEVVVAFAHGDLRSPYVMGSLWNDKDTPPSSSPDDEGGPRHRVPR